MQPPNDVVVIIPVRNGMQDLPECLAALSKQRDIVVRHHRRRRGVR